MKHVLSILTLLLTLCPLAASAQDDSLAALRTSKQIVTLSEADLPPYAIQILAVKVPPEDASIFSNIEKVYEYRSADGLSHYYVGSYKTYAEANKALQGVRELGFPEAFIANLSKTAKSTASKSSKLVTTGHKPIEIDPTKDYVVQIGAFRYPLYISFFENVDVVYEYRLNDKIFRYTTKPYKGTEIEAALNQMRSLGYDNAFIVEYDTYAPFRIE